MSAESYDASNDPAHDAGLAHGTLGSYMIGFGLSVLLTAIPFWLVITKALANPQATGIVIMAFAAVQIVVHMIFFLHMSTRSEGGWTFMALIFTVVLVVITLSGSMWVMYHLNHNMMPMDAHVMSQMP
jgi:cytochrome o ubiquinol oxidase subunit IV